MFRKGWAASLYVQRMYREATFLPARHTLLYFKRDIPKGQGATAADGMTCWDTSEHGTRRTIDFLNPYKEALQ
jgi:hypothetical protein